MLTLTMADTCCIWGLLLASSRQLKSCRYGHVDERPLPQTECGPCQAGMRQLSALPQTWLPQETGPFQTPAEKQACQWALLNFA